MWKHKHLFFVIIGGILAIISGQLLYPYQRAVPFAHSMGKPVGFTSYNDLSAAFQTQFEGTSVELSSGSRTATTTLAKLGAELDGESMTSQLTNYPLWQRLIPFSIIAKWPAVDSLTVRMSGTKLNEVTSALASQLSYMPTDASFAITNGAVVPVRAQAGKLVTADDVRRALITASYNSGTTKVSVVAAVHPPARTDTDIASAVAQAQASLQRTLTIRIEGKGDFVPDLAARASWITVKADGNSTTLSPNTDAIRQYVDQLNTKVKVDPVDTVVSLTDGIEQSRKEGVAGAAINADGLVSAIGASLLNSSSPAVILTTLTPVTPQISYQRAYSHSQSGLSAYVAYATSTQNVRIAVQQLDGTGWSASGRADESIPSASTYKLYVMMRVFDDINSGKLTWDAPMLDTTAGDCFERTIVPSTNPCAEEWIRQYGRNQLNDYVHSKGFSDGTGFTFSDATHTTAGDLAKYLIGLNNGTLVSGDNRTMLLDKMSRQLYRYGIPTGVPGVLVQDKVGFLWDYIHDAAIIHKPQGTYVMVIMTKGYSYGYIANVAKQIDTILYP